jgi:RES domain-containing protein
VARRRKTALLEVGAIADVRGIVRAIASRAMLTVDVDLSRALDLRDAHVRAALGVTLNDLYGPWLREQNRRRFPLTQRIGEAARSEQFEAIIAPSGADKPGGWNLVIFPETMLRTSTVSSTKIVPARLPFAPETLRGRISP